MTQRRWLVINPNTTAAMTDAICAQIARHAPLGVSLTGATGRFGAPVVADRASFAMAAAAALDAYARCGSGMDGLILACFGDPGLAALREVCAVPVMALADASFAAAPGPFAVLTAGAPWQPMLLEQLATNPAGPRCRGVWTLDATGADVVANPDAFTNALDTLAREAVDAGAEHVVLGGAALAGFASRLKPVASFIDCVGAAVAALSAAPDAHAARTGIPEWLARFARQ